MATAQEAKTVISLRGSVTTVVEFFGYAVNSLLYQRGVYPPEYFTPVEKYNLKILVSTDPGLKAYLGKVLQQLSEWLMRRMVQKLVLVISGSAGETVERWQFDIDQDAQRKQQGPPPSDANVQREIQAIIKQITATQTFLPLLPDECSFDLLVYTHADADVPTTWELSDPKLVVDPQNVKLRSFSTHVHKVDASVTYRQQ